MDISQKNWFKYFVGFMVCFFIRLVPFRPPNIEPILVTQMPFSKVYGSFASFFFGFLSMILFDLATGHFGLWSFLTGSVYGVLGLWASHFFSKKEPSRLDYVKFAIIGTLLFDSITGLSIGPMFFHQSFLNALFGQIPFTLLHLVGNVSFSFLLSPIIYNSVIKKKKIETVPNIIILKPKII